MRRSFLTFAIALGILATVPRVGTQCRDLTLLGAGCGSTVPPLLPNLVAYYAFDEVAGDAIDSHNGHTGVETSGTIGVGLGAGANTGTSRDFESVDTEYFLITDDADFAMGAGDWTIATWMNIENTTSAKYIFQRREAASPNTGYGFFVASTSSAITTQTSDGTNANATISSVASGTWAHIVIVRAGSVITLYKDGAFVGTGTARAGSLDFATNPTIGVFTDLTLYFDGLLDELAIWKGKALSATEVTFLYSAGAGTNYAQVIAYVP